MSSRVAHHRSGSNVSGLVQNFSLRWSSQIEMTIAWPLHTPKEKRERIGWGFFQRSFPPAPGQPTHPPQPSPTCPTPTPAHPPTPHPTPPPSSSPSRVLAKAVVGEGDVFGQLAADRRDRRAQAQALLDDAVQVLQAAQRVERHGARAAAKDRVDLLVQAVLDRRVQRNQVQRPRQRGRGRVLHGVRRASGTAVSMGSNERAAARPNVRGPRTGTLSAVPSKERSRCRVSFARKRERAGVHGRTVHFFADVAVGEPDAVVVLRGQEHVQKDRAHAAVGAGGVVALAAGEQGAPLLDHGIRKRCFRPITNARTRMRASG